MGKTLGGVRGAGTWGELAAADCAGERVSFESGGQSFFAQIYLGLSQGGVDPEPRGTAGKRPINIEFEGDIKKLRRPPKGGGGGGRSASAVSAPNSRERQKVSRSTGVPGGKRSGIVVRFGQ